MVCSREYELNTKRMEISSVATKLEKIEEQKHEMLGVINKLHQEKAELAGEKEDLEKINRELAEEVCLTPFENRILPKDLHFNPKL